MITNRHKEKKINEKNAHCINAFTRSVFCASVEIRFCAEDL